MVYVIENNGFIANDVILEIKSMQDLPSKRFNKDINFVSVLCLSLKLYCSCRFELAVNRVEDTDHVVIPVHLREKYKQSGYNHTSTPLFGQPFLIAVPRTVSEDKFYNMLLLRLWYVGSETHC